MEIRIFLLLSSVWTQTLTYRDISADNRQINSCLFTFENLIHSSAFWISIFCVLSEIYGVDCPETYPYKTTFTNQSNFHNHYPDILDCVSCFTRVHERLPQWMSYRESAREWKQNMVNAKIKLIFQAQFSLWALILMSWRSP